MQVPAATDLIVAASLITHIEGVVEVAETFETREVGTFKVVELVLAFSVLNFCRSVIMFDASPLT